MTLSMPSPTNTYTGAVEISKEFLGPAGERFLRRQITTHLGIEPEKLESIDMQTLVNWVRLTFAVLTKDARLVDDFSDRLLGLADQQTDRPSASARATHVRAR
jgi:hypothetical protein